MVVDFTENIESLEIMVWNFILSPDNDLSELKPKNHESLSREELINMVLPKYFNSDERMETYKYALKFFKEYGKIPNKTELKRLVRAYFTCLSYLKWPIIALTKNNGTKVTVV